MQHRSIQSRARGWAAAATGVGTAAGIAAAVALAFASVASAAPPTSPVVYTPTDGHSLSADIATANAAPAGTLSIMQLCGCEYQPAAVLTISNDIEITGPPTFQSTTQAPDINGANTFSLSTPLIQVNPSGQLLIKGVDITGGGTMEGQGALQLTGGTTEVDNTAIDGSNGTAIVSTSSTVNLTVTNSTIGDGSFDALEAQGHTTLINDTILNNPAGGIEGPNIKMYNTVIDASAPDCYGTLTGLTTVGDFADDTTCGTNGVTVSTALGGAQGFTGFYGGPTESSNIGPGDPLIGKGNPTYCPTADQRFFTYTKGSNGSCDVGSYQSTGSQDTGTTGPACTVASINESTNPSVASTETVNTTATNPIGLGADAVPGVLSPTANGATTTNGTVAWPTVGNSWLDAVSPSLTPDQGYPSTSPAFPVTASKPVGDTTVNDTKWSYYATDWLGNTTLCK